MEKQYTCVIPARYKSTRFEGKPLVPIHGKPMILWVIEHANQSKYIKEAIVATDDQRIFDLVTDAGYKAVMTSDDIPNGSARVAAVAADLDDEWIFEMQGDQPMVTPDVIDDFIGRSVAEIDKNNNVDVVIPFSPTTDAHTESPDVVKVVVTSSNRFAFQTRYPIKSGYRTLGLYFWKNAVLQQFAATEVSPIEKAEDSHPIRLYMNDNHVQGILIEDTSWVEVDRDFQIEEAEKLMKEKGIV